MMTAARRAEIVQSAKDCYERGESHPNIIHGVTLGDDGCLTLHFAKENAPFTVTADKTPMVLAALERDGSLATADLQKNCYYVLAKRLIATPPCPH